MNLDRELSRILWDWREVTTDDRATDRQYAHAWRSVPGLIVELNALRDEKRKRDAADVRRAEVLGKYDALTLGLSELVFDIEDRFNKAKAKETIKTLSQILTEIEKFFEPAREWK